MNRSIKKVAILGSGTMGSGIAAHLANAGIHSFLLDIVPKELTQEEINKDLSLDSIEVRNRISRTNKKKFILDVRPAAIMDKDDADLIKVGNMEDNLSWLSEADWIIEVVPENLEIKKQVIGKILPYIKPGTIVSTNTSGISVNKIAEDTTKEFRKYWLGTHFFNPVRYMKLLEIIPCDDTLPEIVQFMADFGERVLGKGIVFCKDTPNFIANRIGASLGTDVIRLMLENDMTISEVDAITGNVLGRPKTGTFKLYDMVGLDIGVASATVVRDNVSNPEEKEKLNFPPFIYEMLDRRMLGRKTKGGFYKRQGKDNFMIDINTLEYEPLKVPDFPSLKAAKKEKSLARKLEVFFEGNDLGAKLVWEHMKNYFLHAASRIPEISESILNIDRAMCWGYNHMAGPFEIWNGLDLQKYILRMEDEGEEIPSWIKEMLELDITSFYKTQAGVDYYYSMVNKKYLPIEQRPGSIVLRDLKTQNKAIMGNEAATLYDIGDGIVCLEIHSKNSAVSTQLVEAMINAQDELDRNWEAMVIAGSGKNFCVGADLTQILPYIAAKKWSNLDAILKTAQDVYMRNKYSFKPVVMAPYGMVLGGGCEMAMHGSAVQASGETYMGLVEVGVGLVPAGGGVKEMTIRALEQVKGTNAFAIDFIKPHLENIGTAKVSASAKEARKLGYLKSTDGITLNNDLLLADAKKKAMELVEKNYIPMVSKPFPALGINDNALPIMEAKMMLDAGMISEYDLYLFKRLLYIMTGGGVTKGTIITEQYLLDLEREVFVDLCKEQKTQERIEHMLTKGKPLRN